MYCKSAAQHTQHIHYIHIHPQHRHATTTHLALSFLPQDSMDWSHVKNKWFMNHHMTHKRLWTVHLTTDWPHPKHIHNEDMNHIIHSIPLLLPCDLSNQCHIKNKQFDEQSHEKWMIYKQLQFCLPRLKMTCLQTPIQTVHLQYSHLHPSGPSHVVCWCDTFLNHTLCLMWCFLTALTLDAAFYLHGLSFYIYTFMLWFNTFILTSV
jgi:hypothetical protein